MLRHASSNPLKIAKGLWAGFNWEAVIGISWEAIVSINPAKTECCSVIVDYPGCPEDFSTCLEDKCYYPDQPMIV